MSIIEYGIGMPFTSTISACNQFNRSSIYYDPLNEYSNMYPRYVKNIMVFNFKNLEKKISYWLKLKQNKKKYKNNIFNFKSFLK